MRARFKSALGFIMMLLIIAIVLFAFYFVYKNLKMVYNLLLTLHKLLQELIYIVHIHLKN